MAGLTEMLIESVEKYPILYDFSHEDYKNIRKKGKLWDEIGQAIHITDRYLILKQKNVKALDNLKFPHNYI